MTRQDGEGAASEKTDPSGQGTEGGGGVHCVWRRGLDSAWAGEIGGRRRGEKFAGLNTLNDTAHELIGPHVTVLPETPALSALRRRRTTNSSTSTRPLYLLYPASFPTQAQPLQSPHISAFAFASAVHQSLPFGMFKGIFGSMCWCSSLLFSDGAWTHVGICPTYISGSTASFLANTGCPR